MAVKEKSLRAQIHDAASLGNIRMDEAKGANFAAASVGQVRDALLFGKVKKSAGPEAMVVGKSGGKRFEVTVRVAETNEQGDFVNVLSVKKREKFTASALP